MTKDAKIAGLGKYMATSKRADETSYNHFSDTAPEGLKDIFLEHYNVKDLDYEIFGRALDIVEEVYIEHPAITRDAAEIEIYERDGEEASPYTIDRLGYLDNHTESEISDLMFDMGVKSIADACAYWYDKQVQEAAIIINDWIHAPQI